VFRRGQQLPVLEPLAPIPHPSYYYRKDLEPKVLGELRGKIRTVRGS
jgi:hypothetical protein